MRLIDADKLKTSLNETVDAAIKWHEDCLGEIMQNRSEATILTFVECIKAVEEAPTVDAVEVVHGEWNKIEIIDDDSGNGVNDDASQCSVCGDVFDSYHWAKTYFNYCPHCRAKMKGAEDGPD